jgi:hypothetical protein
MSESIKFSKSGVTIYLWQSGKKRTWIYRFYYLDEFEDRVEVKRSAKTPVLDVAKDKAYEAWKVCMGISKSQASKPRTVSGLPGLDVVAALYEKRIRQVTSTSLAADSVRNNVNALKRFVQVVFGKDLKAVNVGKLGSGCVNTWWRKRYLAKGLEFGVDEDLRLNSSLNSDWSAVKSVFSKAALRLYRGHWPRLNMEDFLSVGSLEGMDTRFRVIPAGVMAAMDRDSLELPGPERVAYELARYYALTRREILTVRWNWIEGTSEAPVLNICYREADVVHGCEAWKSKRNTKYGLLGLDPEMVAKWRELVPCANAYGYVIPAEHKTAREAVVRRLNRWLGDYIPDRSKKLHELRKQAGSEFLAQSGNIYETAKFIRDSVATTEKHYVDLQVTGLTRYNKTPNGLNRTGSDG